MNEGYEVRIFLPWHLHQIDVGENWDIYREHRLQQPNCGVCGPAYTLYHEGDIIGIGGIDDIMDGVGAAWLFLGKDFLKHKKTLIRVISNVFIKHGGGYHRIHAVVNRNMLPKDQKRLKRFAEFFGFKKEAIMRKFDSEKNDYLLMARIQEI